MIYHIFIFNSDMICHFEVNWLKMGVIENQEKKTEILNNMIWHIFYYLII